MNPDTPEGSERDGRMIDAMAAEWVVRQRAGLDGAAARALAVWRARDRRHDAAFRRYEALFAAFERARTTGVMRQVAAGLVRRSRQRRVRRLVMAGAAALVVMFFAGGGLDRSATRVRLAPHAVPSVATVRRLPDGSVVELGRGARLSVHFGTHFRRVALDAGQALFHVVHDAAHPFIVRAGGVDVRDVGTAFAVRLDPDKVEILVTEGKVALDDARGRPLMRLSSPGRSAALTAGEKAVVARFAPRTAAVAMVTPVEMTRLLAWRNARMVYDGTPLALAVAALNEHNSIQITLADPSLQALRISGAFPADDPRTFARLAAETFGLRYQEETNGNIVLRDR